MRAELLATLTFLKVLVFLIGFGFIFWSSISGLVKGTPNLKAKSFLYFFWTAGGVIFLMLLDYLVIYFVSN
ncbi:hypothetical protein [Rufibacter roseus]|uniref:Uncharacterized protein n=1 Tax=Rufibacter roseus TaxID=1567108 RepID=A0ABW2DHD4_9BACT|nr:hypothetical protein [Rufibacter roseus]